MSEKYIYEVVEYPDDERYYSYGFWNTFEDALEQLNKRNLSSERISDFSDEGYEEFAILKRPLEVWEHGDVERVFTLKRTHEYFEEIDDCIWTCKKETTKNEQS